MIYVCEDCGHLFNREKSFVRCATCLGRYRPAIIVVKTIEADQRYYKLASGNILDMESKTIINRDSLQALLDG